MLILLANTISVNILIVNTEDKIRTLSSIFSDVPYFTTMVFVE